MKLGTRVNGRIGPLVPVLVFLAALLLRLAAGAAVPGLQTASNDAEAYRDLAHNLVSRGQFVTTCDPPHSLDQPYATRPPLTPLCLAAGYLIFGEGPWSELLVLGFLGALACVAVYWLGRELFGARSGLIAASLTAVYPFFFVLAAVPLTESSSLPLYPLLALFLVRFARAGRLPDGVAAGVMLGLAALSKAVVIGFYPLVLIALIAANERRQYAASIPRFLLVGAVAGLIISPWTLRNYLTMGTFIPVNLQFGSVLYQGSGPDAEYAVSRLERGVTNGWDYPPVRKAIPPRGGGPVAEDREAARRAVAYIRQDPGRFARLAWRKEMLFWGAYSHPAHRLSWGLVAPLALLGVWLTRRRWRELMPVYLLIGQTALIPIFFTSMPRFRAPVDPLLLLFAAQSVIAGRSMVLTHIQARERMPATGQPSRLLRYVRVNRSLATPARFVIRCVADWIKRQEWVVSIQSGVGAGLKMTTRKAALQYLLGTCEPEVQQVFQQCLKPGDVFYDIGANVGFTTLIGLRLVGPQGHVVAFEPVPDTADVLRRNLSLNGFTNAAVLVKAAASRTGRERFLIASDSTWSKMASTGHALYIVDEISVETVCIDELLAVQGIRPPSFVKIDVEGAEIGVLRGLADTLSRYQPILLVQSHATNEQLRSLLQEFGYDYVVLNHSEPCLAKAPWNATVLAVPSTDRSDFDRVRVA